jgi:hypothetical protein
MSTLLVRVRDNGQYANVDPGIKAWVESLKDHDGVGTPARPSICG